MLSFLKKNQNSGDAWLFAGLGNPGDKYAGNRHNIGFMAVDEIAGMHGFADYRGKFSGLFSEGRIEGSRIVLLKPGTYMNNSGQAVKAAAAFFRIAPDKVVAFHDELDIEPGKIRVKFGGGNAGHNGLKSIQAHLGTADFWRVRMGIGHPGDKDQVHNYVLGDFSKAERAWLAPLLGACARHAGLLAKGDEAAYMSKVALDAPAPGAAKKQGKES